MDDDPSEWKIIADSGIKTTYPNSAAVFDIIPANTMANVVILRGAFITTKRITVDNNPARSAIPTPSKSHQYGS